MIELLMVIGKNVSGFKENEYVEEINYDFVSKLGKYKEILNFWIGLIKCHQNI